MEWNDHEFVELRQSYPLVTDDQWKRFQDHVQSSELVPEGTSLYDALQEYVFMLMPDLEGCSSFEQETMQATLEAGNALHDAMEACTRPSEAP